MNWQMIQGESAAGISVIRVDSGIDTGPVLAKTMLTIDVDDTVASMHEKANKEFPRLVLEVVSEIEKGTLRAEQQDESRAAYWHQRNDEDGHLDFKEVSAVEADRFIRALTSPYPGAFSFRGDARVRVFKARIPGPIVKGTPGRVCYIQGEGPFVVCKDRAILLEDYRFEGNPGERLRHGERLS